MSKQNIDTLLEEIITLPSLPAALARIIQLVSSEDSSMGEVGKAISADPAIALKTLRLANSASFGLRHRIASVEHAVSMLGGKVIQRAGASVTMIPGAEIFQALEKGAIDATEFSMPVVDQLLGFSRVAKYNYFPGWHQPHTAFHLVVHKPTWDALAASTRETIEMACGDGVHRNLAKAEAAQGPALIELQEAGVETRTLSAELLEALATTTDEILDEQAAADADFARVLAHQRAFRASYARWRSLAYPAPTDPATDPHADPHSDPAVAPGNDTQQLEMPSGP